MNFCKINGKSFDVDVAISSLEENFSVLDGENTGRVLERGRMIRDVIGTFIGHKITFFRKGDSPQAVAAIDELWSFLVAHSVDDSVMLEAADNQSTIAYEAYYTAGKRKISRSTGDVNYWDEIEVSFVPMEAQVTP